MVSSAITGDSVPLQATAGGAVIHCEKIFVAGKTINRLIISNPVILVCIGIEFVAAKPMFAG